jgi:anti-anti-sigma factor
MTSKENLLTQWLDEQVLITAPEEIDATNSHGLRDNLLAAISRPPGTVIIDMTGTTFCDSSGMAAIVSCYRQAAAAGADLRLVIGHSLARRVFELNGVDIVIGIYPDHDQRPVPQALYPGGTAEQRRLRQITRVACHLAPGAASGSAALVSPAAWRLSETRTSAAPAGRDELPVGAAHGRRGAVPPGSGRPRRNSREAQRRR